MSISLKLDVVVITYNSAPVLERCLRSLSEGGVPDGVRIVVWDNASTDGSPDIARNYASDVLRAGSNLGFARACNAAAATSDSEWLMFLNPDCVAPPGFLAELLRLLGEAEPVALMAPAIRNLDGSVQDARPGLPTPRSEIRYALAGRHGGKLGSNTEAYLSGACLVAPRAVWDRLGGFDERYFLYGEDADLSRRAQDLGIGLEALKGAHVCHEGSQGLRAKTPSSLRLVVSGKVTYHDRFHGRAAARAVLVAYRVGAFLRVLRSLLFCDSRSVRLWWAVVTLTEAQALYFGRPEETPLRVLGWPGLRQTGRNPYTVKLYRAMRGHGADVGDLAQIHRLVTRADVVHVHWPDATLNVRSLFGAAWRAARLLLLIRYLQLRGSALVWTVHNLQPHAGRHPRLTEMFMNRWASFVDAFVFNSTVSRSQAVSKWPKAMTRPYLISTLPSYKGLHDPTESREQTRARYNIDEHADLILFAGHIRRYKRVELLIDAFDAARPDLKDARVLIVGSVHDRTHSGELTERAKQTTGVTLIDTYLDDDELGNLLQAADLLVLPLEDALNSSSVILGMSYGTRVLAPATPTNRELLATHPSSSLVLYDPPLCGEDLVKALQVQASAVSAAELPTFEDVAATQLAFFSNLVHSRHRHRGGRGRERTLRHPMT